MSVDRGDTSGFEGRVYNGAVETSTEQLQNFLPPDYVDLFAYYHNPRTEFLAENRRRSVFWGVGLEFSRTGLVTPNYYQINSDAKRALRFIRNNRVGTISIFAPLPSSDYSKDLFNDCKKKLQKGGQLVTVDFINDARSTKILQKLGFTISHPDFTEVDMLSEVVGSKYPGQLVKVVAIKK